MNHIQSKIKAVIEVLFVFFFVFFLIGVLFASPLGEGTMGSVPPVE